MTDHGTLHNIKYDKKGWNKKYLKNKIDIEIKTAKLL